MDPLVSRQYRTVALALALALAMTLATLTAIASSPHITPGEHHVSLT
jgi:Spy/CpxP family protein refolding chaperone